MKKLAVLSVAVLGLAAVAGGSSAAPVQQQAAQKNIVQVAASGKQFTTLVSLVKQAGLAGALSKGKLTVFAPTNAAFAQLKRTAPDTFAAVASDKKLLKKVLTYHVVGKAIPAKAALAAAKKNAKVKTLEGERITLSLKGGKISLNGGARVVTADVKASNGVIHVINRVIVPPSLS
jgi:uncharacterized surface protein with fasciclin (FAS1) repeats